MQGAAILAALERAEGGLDGVVYTIPVLVRVRRAAQEVGEDTVRDVVERFLHEALGAGAADGVLRSVSVAGPVLLPAGPYRARVIAPVGAPLLGRVRLQVEFSVDGRPVRTVWVTADIGLYGPVVVARRPIARGETIAPADLSVERRDLSQVPRGIVTDLAEAAGRAARAQILPFVPIRREQVAASVAVRRGDVVLLVAERGALRLTAPGEVREEAAIGDQVRVVNRATRKDLIGHVLDGSTVAVEF